MMTASRLRIIVTGLVGQHPVGGVAWDYLQYVVGLHRMGHDVYYHEDTWSWSYHPIQRQNTADGSYSATFIESFFRCYAPELVGRWHYLHLHETSFGMPRSAFDEIASTADLFLNVSGACILPDDLSPRCLKVFLDTDPGYNQIMLSERFEWSENVDRWCASVADHDRHLTYAENIHGPDCQIPKLGYDWQTTRVPIALDLWDSIAERQPPPDAPWTTVMTWNAFRGKLVYRGSEYGSKGAEFEKLLDLPARLMMPFRVAVGGIDAPLGRLAEAGWQVLDAPSTTLTPGRYQDFIGQSRGELSPAKQVYAALRSGWFSSRSACYLAAGRPVVVQDTRFGTAVPTGEGLFAFNTMDEALAALETISSDYERHSRSARTIAGEYFQAETVLAQLLRDVGF